MTQPPTPPAPGATPAPNRGGWQTDPTRAAAALAIVRRLQEAGHAAFYVGGCVRNWLLGLPVDEIDIATDARPPQIVELFPQVELVGAHFGVSLVVQGAVRTDVATFRTEGPYEDHRHPAAVTFATQEEDYRRRDFTINALYYDPLADRIIDLAGGRADLAARQVRCVGEPDRRFAEDALRILRAVRFAARFGFQVEPATWAAMKRNAPALARISRERVWQELAKILVDRNRARAMDLLSESGVFAAIIPEIDAMHGVEQPPQFHPEGDVFVHTRLCLETLEGPAPAQPGAPSPPPSPRLALATLLHDVGKPRTFVRAADRIRFPLHANVGGDMASEICQRLRVTNEDREAIVFMVRRHMTFIDLPQMRAATLARFLAAPTIDEELCLHRADCLSSHRMLTNYELARAKLAEARARVAALGAETGGAARSNDSGGVLPPPLLSGRDLRRMGFLAGPLFSRILRRVQTEQLEGRLTTAADAEQWVLRRYGRFVGIDVRPGGRRGAANE